MKNIENYSFSFNSENETSVQQNLIKFREFIGSSQVVALGENAHFIKEFFLLRHQIIQFLITECDFDTLAFEFGFSEGLKIDNWIKSKLPIEDLDALLSHFYYPQEFKATLHWLRNFNLQNDNRVSFLGVDIPHNGGSYFPNFQIVSEYLLKNEVISEEIIARVFTLIKGLNFYSTAQLALNLTFVEKSEHWELKALLSNIYVRLLTLQPLLDGLEFQSILHQVKGLIYMNYNAEAMGSFINGNGLYGDMGAKDQFMAESVQWYFENTESKKMILIAHNAHIQKLPVAFDGFVSCYPMGQRLDALLGSNYKAFAITNQIGYTAALYPDNEFEFGFKVDRFRLETPEPNSIEYFLNDNGIKEGFLCFEKGVDFKVVNKIRFDSIYVETDLSKAFDGVFLIGKSTVSEVV